MMFQITTYCDQGCPHCMGDYNINGIHTKFDTIKQLCEFTENNEVPILAISGGEPTKHPDFLDVFGYILHNTPSVLGYALISNGSFLMDKKIKDGLEKLQRHFKFQVIITAIKGLYKNVDRTKRLAKINKNRIGILGITEKLEVFENIGRAKGKFDQFNQYFERKERLAPSCFNFLSLANYNKTSSFKDIIKEYHSHTRTCIPMISYKGDIHIGELLVCKTAGTIWDGNKTIMNNLLNIDHCNECGYNLGLILSALKYKYNRR